MGEPKFKKGEISATQAYQIANELNNKSYKELAISRDFKKGGNQRESEEFRKSGIESMQKSDRIRASADNAMKAAQSDTGNKTSGFIYKLNK